MFQTIILFLLNSNRLRCLTSKDRKHLSAWRWDTEDVIKPCELQHLRRWDQGSLPDMKHANRPRWTFMMKRNKNTAGQLPDFSLLFQQCEIDRYFLLLFLPLSLVKVSTRKKIITRFKVSNVHLNVCRIDIKLGNLLQQVFLRPSCRFLLFLFLFLFNFAPVHSCRK